MPGRRKPTWSDRLGKVAADLTKISAEIAAAGAEVDRQIAGLIKRLKEIGERMDDHDH